MRKRGGMPRRSFISGVAAYAASMAFPERAGGEGQAAKKAFTRTHFEWSKIVQRAAEIARSVPATEHADFWAEAEKALDSREYGAVYQIKALDGLARHYKIHPASLLMGLLSGGSSHGRESDALKQATERISKHEHWKRIAANFVQNASRQPKLKNLIELYYRPGAEYLHATRPGFQEIAEEKALLSRTHAEWSEVAQRAARIGREVPEVGYPWEWAEAERALGGFRLKNGVVLPDEQMRKLDAVAKVLDAHPANLLLEMLHTNFFGVREISFDEFVRKYAGAFRQEGGRAAFRRARYRQRQASASREGVAKEAENIYKLALMAEEDELLKEIIRHYRENVEKNEELRRAVKGLLPYYYVGNTYHAPAIHNAGR